MDRRAVSSRQTTAAQWPARVGSVLIASAGIFLTVSFLTYTPNDSPWLSSSPNHPAANLGGAVGAWLATLGRGGFGFACFILAVLCGLWASRLWHDRLQAMHKWSVTLGTLCLLTSLGTLMAMAGADEAAQASFGGVIGCAMGGALGLMAGLGLQGSKITRIEP